MLQGTIAFWLIMGVALNGCSARVLQAAQPTVAAGAPTQPLPPSTHSTHAHTITRQSQLRTGAAPLAGTEAGSAPEAVAQQVVDAWATALPPYRAAEPVPQAEVACPAAGQRIVSVSASWGCLAAPGTKTPEGPYESGWECPEPPPPICASCTPDSRNPPKDVGAIVEKACLGQPSCAVPATSDVLGDPCVYW